MMPVNIAIGNNIFVTATPIAFPYLSDAQSTSSEETPVLLSLSARTPLGEYEAQAQSTEGALRRTAQTGKVFADPTLTKWFDFLMAVSGTGRFAQSLDSGSLVEDDLTIHASEDGAAVGGCCGGWNSPPVGPWGCFPVIYPYTTPYARGGSFARQPYIGPPLRFSFGYPWGNGAFTPWTSSWSYQGPPPGGASGI